MLHRCAILFIIATVFFPACDRSPVQPTPIRPPSVSGIWQGGFVVVECRANAADTRGCAHNRTGTIRLELQQNDAQVEGTLSGATSAPIPAGGSFDGQVLILTGSTGLNVVGNQDMLDGWSTRLASNTSTMSGEFVLQLIQHREPCQTPGCSGPIVWTRVYQIDTLARLAPLAGAGR
jgi:hypothetical protein